MKQISTLILSCIVLLLCSCESSKTNKEAEAKAKAFFAALKEENPPKAEQLYPGFGKFESYYKSDSAKVNSVTEKDGIVTVSALNSFTNGYGKLTQKNILLYFKKDSVENLTLYDSKGLSSFEDKDAYKFGVKSGCVNLATDTTDQQLRIATMKAEVLMIDKTLEVYTQLLKGVKVVNWEWESGYSGSASGKAIVKNNSTFRVPRIKYKVTYKDRRGNDITSDDGYVSYDAIDAGESKSFTFYTSYVGNASNATISLDFDQDQIMEYIATTDWTGTECEGYFKKTSE